MTIKQYSIYGNETSNENATIKRKTINTVTSDAVDCKTLNYTISLCLS